MSKDKHDYRLRAMEDAMLAALHLLYERGMPSGSRVFLMALVDGEAFSSSATMPDPGGGKIEHSEADKVSAAQKTLSLLMGQLFALYDEGFKPDDLELIQSVSFSEILDHSKKDSN